MFITIQLVANPHILVQATSERYLPTWATFRVGLASESHRWQLVLVLTIHWWPALVCVGWAIRISHLLCHSCACVSLCSSRHLYILQIEPNSRKYLKSISKFYCPGIEKNAFPP